MITPKDKMRVNLAVQDYIKMFPKEYKDFLVVIEQQRQSLDNEMAELKETHAIKRALSTIPEKLFQMIQQKLGDTIEEFKSLDVQRWFVKEHPQFKVTKHV